MEVYAGFLEHTDTQYGRYNNLNGFELGNAADQYYRDREDMQMNKKPTTIIKYLLLGFVVSIFIVACSSSKASEDFRENNWKLVSIGGEPAIPNIDVTALFDGNGGLSGFGGCNDYTGNYGVSINQLQINVSRTTTNVCDLSVMTQEEEFLNSLSSASSFEFGDNPDLASVIDLDGKILMTLERFTP